MDQPLKPQPLMRHVLPGLFLIILLIGSYYFTDPDHFLEQLQKIQSLAAKIIAVLSVTAFFAAWIIGNILDVIRNIIDEITHRIFKEQWWEFLFTANKEGVERLDEYYYNYYVLDANFAISILITLVVSTFLCRFSRYEWFLLILFILIAADAILLRIEINNVVKEHGEKYKK